MKSIGPFVVVLMVAIGMVGCASFRPYLVDRGRDAADVFTITVGYGAGAKARVGPVHLGLLGNVDKAGLRGGQVFAGGQGIYDFLLPLPLPYEQSFVSGWEAWDPDGTGPERGKDFFTCSRIPLCIAYNAALSHEGNEINDMGTRLGKPSWPYFSQVELVAGLGLTARLGFNPGEFLDFILGWTTIDIFNDDVQPRTQEHESNKRLQAIGAKARLQPEP